MKFTLEIDKPNTALTIYALREVAKIIQGQALFFEQTRSIQDANGNTIGKWEVTDTPAAPIERMYAEAFEDEDDPDQTMTEQCRRGTHDGCPDVDANCCECSCHFPV